MRGKRGEEGASKRETEDREKGGRENADGGPYFRYGKRAGGRIRVNGTAREREREREKECDQG